MGTVNDPFEVPAGTSGVSFDVLLCRKPSAGTTVPALPSVATARLHGFALDDSPLLADLAALSAEIVPARTVVGLRREQIGARVVVAFEAGDSRQPIVLGVLQHAQPRPRPEGQSLDTTVQANEERYEICAEREIVLRCGNASITLTRAGKVLIKGNYILSRSTGYNKIKGAAVDIN